MAALPLPAPLPSYVSGVAAVAGLENKDEQGGETWLVAG